MPIVHYVCIVRCSQVTNTAIRHISQSNQLLVTFALWLARRPNRAKALLLQRGNHNISTGVQKDWWILEAILRVPWAEPGYESLSSPFVTLHLWTFKNCPASAKPLRCELTMLRKPPKWAVLQTRCEAPRQAPGIQHDSCLEFIRKNNRFLVKSDPWGILRDQRRFCWVLRDKHWEHCSFSDPWVCSKGKAWLLGPHAGEVNVFKKVLP